MRPFPSDGRGIPDERPSCIFVDEDYHRACEDRLVLAVDHVSAQWLRGGRDEGYDGAVGTRRHDALVNREGSGVL